MDHATIMRAYRERWEACTDEQRAYYRQYWRSFFPDEPAMRPPGDSASPEPAATPSASPPRPAKAGGAAPSRDSSTSSRKRPFRDDESASPDPSGARSPCPWSRSSTRRRVEEPESADVVKSGFGGTIVVEKVDVDVLPCDRGNSPMEE